MDKEFKQELKKKKFSGLVKDISKETRRIHKLKKDRSLAKTPEERDKLGNYIQTIEKKVGMCLKAMTKDKAESANLPQLAKAFRVLSDKQDIAKGKAGTVREERKLSIDIKVDNLSKEDLLELLGKKSQEYNK